MNAEFEKYIEGLSPELQEKARACKTREELNEFIAENDLELPEDALEMVSGGCGTSSKKEVWVCNTCNSTMQGKDSNGCDLFGTSYPIVKVQRNSNGFYDSSGKTMFSFCPTCKKWYEYSNSYMRKEMR